MTDAQITEARTLITAGLTAFMTDSEHTREAKAQARRAAAEVLTELRRMRMAIDAAYEALRQGLSG